MWDLPPFEIRDGQIHSRACDDLIGCAEIICVFRELEERGANAHCVGLFTRAEEVGFVGAIKLAKAEILPRSLTILSLETSTPRGTAEIGKGPIVRVGDKASIFDGPATARLLAAAAAEKIPVQRCLLDGGTCEATAYQLYGYTCAAASVALGNYHNVTPEGTIARGVCRDRRFRRDGAALRCPGPGRRGGARPAESVAPEARGKRARLPRFYRL